MNGVHDMGGMHGLGPIAPEADEPVFHARWEARALALNLAAAAWGRWTLDASRHQRELIPGGEYLQMSYYEKWIAGLTELLVETGLATREEVTTGVAAAGAARMRPPLTPDRVAPAMARGGPTNRDIDGSPRFVVGDQVRARNLNPVGHTRLPRYVRGHSGRIARGHGAHVFPDANAHGLGERPQHHYQVCFAARDLWGEAASARHSVYLDLWEDYLEPV
jgi:nitrile hydratase beta subunit